LLNGSVQPSLLDSNAIFRTSAEGVTKNAAAQEFEQLLMVHLLEPFFTLGELVVIVTLRMTASGPVF
jgi:hypothetical protein